VNFIFSISKCLNTKMYNRRISSEIVGLHFSRKQRGVSILGLWRLYFFYLYVWIQRYTSVGFHRKL